MTTIRTLCAALFATTLAWGAMARTPPAPSASMPMAGTTLPQECAAPVARHDHGVEKGVYAPNRGQAHCAATAAAATPAQAASAPATRLRHDHTGLR
jgi:hypothetical protein